jgi:hypothetical protein
MIWANFLHIYQPPTQTSEWVKRITEESYRKLFNGLEGLDNAKLTMNANGVLLEHFEREGEHDVLAKMKGLLEAGKLELTGSAKYHPLLPFLSPREIERQIKLNEETHKKYFGDAYKPKGFFPPEMGFSPEIAKVIKDLGYEWIIVDELSFPHRVQQFNPSTIYQIKGLDDFSIYFRERRISWIILSGQVGTGNLLVQSLGDRLHRDEYLLTAMDGETFGHHRPGLEQLLFEIYNAGEIKTDFISNLPNHFTKREQIEPLPSTWALMEKDLERSEPFARWNDSDNEIHVLQWQLTNLALEQIEKADTSHNDFISARNMLDRAIHSDQYWWASAKPWWSIEMIERGAKELLEAIKTMPGVGDEIKSKAQELYQSIIFTAFDWQREGRVDALAKAEDEDIRQRTDANIPKLPRKEVEKMIEGLEKEMNELADAHEFERATHNRNRIAELKRYITENEKASFSKGE